MANKNSKNRIIDAAWELFHEKGYAATTVDDIICKSDTSKGSFYHYFAAKDALLATLSIYLDKEYCRIEETIDETENRFDLLLRMNYEIHSIMQEKMTTELLAQMYSTQLVSKSDRHLLDTNRSYYRLLTRIITEGIERGELSSDTTVDGLVSYYSMCERALIYDWCLNEGAYNLGERSKEWMAVMLEHFKAQS